MARWFAGEIGGVLSIELIHNLIGTKSEGCSKKALIVVSLTLPLIVHLVLPLFLLKRAVQA